MRIIQAALIAAACAGAMPASAQESPDPRAGWEIWQCQSNLRYYSSGSCYAWGEVCNPKGARFGDECPEMGQWHYTTCTCSPPPVPSYQSEIQLTLNVVPRANSTLPGWESYVEQCGEFVYRYFAANGHGWPDYPTLGQPAEYIRRGKYRGSFPAFLNGSKVPPRAGDILAAVGPEGWGMYHTALIWKVEPDAVWVYNANLPWGNASRDPQDHIARFALERSGDGKFFMPQLLTSTMGFWADMDVVGWIHPTGSSRLPGAPD